MDEEQLFQEIDYLGSVDEYLAFINEHFGLEPEAVCLAMDYEKYCDYGCGFFLEFIKDHPEFNTEDFQEYVIGHNKADRDSGELQDIAESEVLRLAGEFAEEHGIKWPVKIRKRIEVPTWEEVLAADGLEGIWEEDLAKKKRPQDYPKGTFHIEDHFRGKSSHKDIRIKRNDHLVGWTITDAMEGAIKEKVDSLSDCKKYPWNDSKIFKFQPDMGDRNIKTVAIKKSQQPLVWLNVRNVAFPPGSVGATKLEWGVFRAVDEGMAHQGVQKSYYNEWFLNGKHFKGRLVFRLIAVRPEWIKKPKGKLQWQCWMTESTAKGQLPYLLSPRGRSRKDVAPPEGESWLPPEWEKKIKSEYRWWPDSKSKQEKIKLIDEAYNDLIERGEIKARKLKLWQEGGIVKSDALAMIPSHVNFIPKELYDKLRNSKDVLSKWILGSPYALPDDAPEEVKKWAADMREGLMREEFNLQTDTAVIIMKYGELKKKGLSEEKIIEEIAQGLLPIGFDLEYWKKKVREVLQSHGLLKSSIKKRGFEDFEYLLHHIHIGEKGKEEIHHCLLYDHIANMFEQAHLLVKDGKVYINGKLIKDGIFHIIKGLEPTQQAIWSDMEAKENKIKPKKMRAGMTLKEKAGEW